MKFAVDSHTHVRSCFDEERFLKSAMRNLGAATDVQAVIFLTETSEDQYFPKWSSLDCPLPVRVLEDGLSLLVDETLLVIGGQQIVTKENLEVLSLLGQHSIPDGLDVDETIAEIENNNSVAVLPWGLGKWLGKRGKIVENVMGKRPSVLLGDNSGRPAFCGWPRALANRITLPGSDPLPTPLHESIVGSYGFTISCPDPHDEPAALLRETLESLDSSPNFIGKRQPLLQCIWSQLAMRFRNRNSL